ncbi:hypothetical protein KKB43_03065, partial [Patescibacteria group bacterium]|nr:hypothetical protein [Patescibacteria group bacterium]
MFNFFLKNSRLKESLACVLIMAAIFSTGVWVLLCPKPAQAALSTMVFDALLYAGKMVWNAVKWVYDKAAAAYHAAADWISAKLGLSQRVLDFLTWARATALNILLHQILAQLTNDITAWIQNGTEPRFLSEGLGDWLGRA